MVLALHKISGINLGAINDLEEADDQSINDIEKLRRLFAEEGTIKSIRIILLAHDHNIPTVILLRHLITGKVTLPGGKVNNGENEEFAIRRILSTEFIIDREYDIVDHVATWYRPQFSEYLYPYMSAHVSTPKEIEKWYFVSIQEGSMIRIRTQHQPFVLSFQQIHNNIEFQEQTISFLPSIMSKFDFLYTD